MNKSLKKVLYFLCIVIITLSVVIAGLGVFYVDSGEPYEIVNQYGDTVKIYGNGIYAHDSYFKAPINKGTDFTMLFIAVPTLIVALIFVSRRNSIKNRMFLASIISVFTYYSTSMAFGVTYNILHLAYCALFSASLFALVLSIISLDTKSVQSNIGEGIPYKGAYVFLVITGISLIVAWLPDILTSIVSGRSLELIEFYTTEITYVIDMGIISPLAFICLYLLKKRNGAGYVILEILLTLCIIIGITVSMQSIFQLLAGIVIPLPALITKVGIFCLLASFALFLNIKVNKNISQGEN